MPTPARALRCCICGAAAEVHCAADDAYLCLACDLGVHSANELASAHVRTRLDGGTEGHARLPPPHARGGGALLHGDDEFASVFESKVVQVRARTLCLRDAPARALSPSRAPPACRAAAAAPPHTPLTAQRVVVKLTAYIAGPLAQDGMERQRTSEEEPTSTREAQLDSLPPAQHSFGLFSNTLIATDFLSNTMDVRPRSRPPRAA